MVSRAMRVSSFVIFPLMIGLAAISKPLVLIMLTDKWLPAVPFMQIMCISGAINSVTNANLQAMKAIGRSDIVLKLEFAKKPVGLLNDCYNDEYQCDSNRMDHVLFYAGLCIRCKYEAQ